MKWVKVKFEAEEGEFDRVATELTGTQPDEIWNSNFKKLKTLYSKSVLTNLTNSIWNKLSNTDSNKPMTMTQIKNAIRSNGDSSGFRDIYGVIGEIVSNSARAPIIILMNNKYILVAGNTRLMACRLLDIVPKVVIINWK